MKLTINYRDRPPTLALEFTADEDPASVVAAIKETLPAISHLWERDRLPALSSSAEADR